MVELVPQLIGEVVILNVQNVCRQDCRSCSDVGAAVHNWLLGSELQYVIIDFQDDKEICPAFLIELLQLHKRLRIPFLFVGVVDRPRAILNEHMFFSFGYPVFVTPEEAVSYLWEKFPEMAGANTTGIRMNEPLQVSRSRSALRGVESGEVEETAAAAEE